MKDLLQLLVRFSNVLLFIGLEGVAVVLFVLNNSYQKSAVLSSCNAVAASVYTVSDNITSYFSLKSDNQRLVEENALLLNRVNQLENQLAVSVDSVLTISYVAADKNLTYIPARVINASTNRQHNYLTLNKGRRDGVTLDMGVVNENGVVGVVCAVSECFSLVIPLINTDIAVSCKFARNNYVGSLHWEGRDIAQSELHDVARHVEVQQGDTILTSGLSSIFPADIPVGVVEHTELTDHDAYHHIHVRLAVDFKRLQYVKIIANHNQAEQVALENSFIDK